MAFTWNLQYRVKGASTWTTGMTGVTKNQGELIATLPGLTMGQTYEFRWQRMNNGNPEAHSNVVEAFLDNTVTSFTDQTATVSAVGTFTLTSGGNSATIVRTTSKLVLQLTANWDYVRIDLNSALNGTTKYYVLKSGSPPAALNTYTANTNVIAKTSNKTVDIKLDKSYTYTVTVKYNGASSGTIQVNSF